MTGNEAGGPRTVALVGSYQSGKTSLLESILSLTGKAHRKDGTSRFFGDSSGEAREREMGTELNIAHTEFMGDKYFFLDCPGSVELFQETLSILSGVDVAVVVVEPDESKIAGLGLLMHALEDRGIPRIIFVNKVDRTTGSIRKLAEQLNAVSTAPVILRHLPIRDDEQVTGYIDLMSERAYKYGSVDESKRIDLPEGEDRLEDARFHLLETLADFDDNLMEALLEDEIPPVSEIVVNLARDFAEGHVVPVLLGSAIHDNGTTRLLKALRHEAPGIAATQKRLGLDGTKPDFLGVCLKTLHTTHGGKRSIVRVLRGSVSDGETVNDERVSGMAFAQDQEGEKRTTASAGDLVAMARLEKIKTGELLTVNGGAAEGPELEVLSPVYSLAISVDNRNDEVKLSTSLAKICDEDPSLTFEQTKDTHQLLIKGQGEMHLRIAGDRLKNRFGLGIAAVRPKVPYQETIRKPRNQHSRFKKQSGGHGQFGDVVVDIKPLPRGSGFVFEESIRGGTVPRQYIPSVETGIKNFLVKGPLGFPVVDIGVTLVDGKYHAVDSSDMAFQLAGRLSMSESLPKCNPVLLEPITLVKIHVPNEYTNRANQLITGRRGQILGFDARQGWPGWDEVRGHIPHSELHDLIIELRSMSAGAGSYTFEFERMTELVGRMADDVVAAHKEEAAH